MKSKILSLIAIVGLMITEVSAQETMQFTFIGNVGGSPDSIIITSNQEFKMKDVEVVHVNNEIIDSLRTYILRKYSERRSSVPPTNDTVADKLNRSTVIKVTGVDLMPLYFSKDVFSGLIFSAMGYFNYAGPTASPNLRFALQRLEFLGQERFFYRNRRADTSAPVDPRLRLKG